MCKNPPCCHTGKTQFKNEGNSPIIKCVPGGSGDLASASLGGALPTPCHVGPSGPCPSL